MKVCLAISVEKKSCDENFLKPTVCVGLLSPSVEKMFNDENGETYIDTAYRRGKGVERASHFRS